MSFAFVLFFNNIIGQKTVNLDTIENTVYLGNFKLKTPSFFKSKIANSLHKVLTRQIRVFVDGLCFLHARGADLVLSFNTYCE